MNTSNPFSQKKKVFNIKAEKLYRDACELFYSKNYDASLELLEQTTILDKNHAKAFILTGDIKLLNEGNEKEALEAYDKALMANPCSTQALGSKAYVLDILGRFEEAFENCEKAKVKYVPIFTKNFKNVGIEFETVNILTPDLTHEQAIQTLENANFLVLVGVLLSKNDYAKN